MKPGPKKGEGGRPKIDLDWDQFDNLSRIHCTLVEIAEFFDISEDTIERRVQEKYGITFAEHYKRKSGSGKRSLRRKMWEAALKKNNITMMIFLSKNVLGFRDRPDDFGGDHPNITIQYTDKKKEK